MRPPYISYDDENDFWRLFKKKESGIDLTKEEENQLSSLRKLMDEMYNPLNHPPSDAGLLIYSEE